MAFLNDVTVVTIAGGESHKMFGLAVMEAMTAMVTRLSCDGGGVGAGGGGDDEGRCCCA